MNLLKSHADKEEQAPDFGAKPLAQCLRHMTSLRPLWDIRLVSSRLIHQESMRLADLGGAPPLQSLCVLPYTPGQEQQWMAALVKEVTTSLSEPLLRIEQTESRTEDRFRVG